ncbi:succinate dehydrogenase, cytochrome b556 subunit [Pseudohalocynthiibacter aestuariivivens]|uniref:Succinate dehydrogenase cytochrome b556 subunit n=1 Tax=Pseudohalocynthiibacter aestuariivivens TaxID=1591409 RepID=A0ABV5JEK7_9RHOB|nr:succinate dehydrogenase, cytochrome b556 subunit [Pseudohalocynthiibacter aestuariivivens]MBS9717012.1 succinate dehydrogenase, cytochrome b556 subunit [Pseudohalocynthiibacter aestuariivivens]
MADVNRGNRPLSPHLSIYRPQITSVLSIIHRITGVGMSLSAVLIVWWFLAAATSPEYFEFVDGLLTSWLGLLVLVASLWAFWFHFFNGIRHLRWDAGVGLGLSASARTGWIAVILSVAMTVLCVILAV